MTGFHSERLYYADSYLIQFEARVLERLNWEGYPSVVLDRTAFYPASGGQPSDRGTLDEIAVIGAEVRESDGAVVHLLARDLPADHVVARVDWARRFDHMQQHTGQHLLSAACERLLDADTVSFHLGSDLSTIDLNVARIPPEAMWAVEDLVNQVIWEDRPLRVTLADPEAVANLPLRRAPQVAGPVRLVEIEGFDLNPCGGTHVAHTGEVGLLKVLRLDYRGQETRVEFKCGRRALEDYRIKNEVVLGLSAALTVGYRELEQAVARLQEELKTARREQRLAQEQTLEEEASCLAQAASPVGPLRLAWGVWEGRDPAVLRALAQKVAGHPNVLAVLVSLADRTHLCVACPPQSPLDAPAILRQACEPLGGKGGGQPHLAQGSAPAVSRQQIEEVRGRIVRYLSPDA